MSALGVALDVQAVGAVSGTNSFYVWRVPAGLVQRWLDEPAKNFGVALMAPGRRVNHVVPTRNFPDARLRPTLWAAFLDYAPEQPANVAPVSFSTVDVRAVALSASEFVDHDAQDRHAASRWQAGVEDADSAEQWGVFAADGTRVGTLPVTVVWEERSRRRLTSAEVPGRFVRPGQTHFWRVQYADNNGRWSEWSLPTAFVAGGARAPEEEAVDADTEPAQNRAKHGRWWQAAIIGGVIVLVAGVYVAVRK